MFGEEDLIDDDAADVHLHLHQLLDESFCFVDGEKLGNADAHKRREFLFVV